MCIIAVKPENKEFPTYQTLKRCWNKNKDGAGYMFPYNHKVIIRKGFMTFSDFMESLVNDVSIFGNQIPYIMHFRITTQGGVKPEFTHPYPVSRNMEDLKLLQTNTDIGMAHNGVISITKDSLCTTNNDTMKFITEFASRLIKNKDFDKDEDVMALLKNISDPSRLAFLDGEGKITLIGNFVKDDTTGLIYSNSSYEDYTYNSASYSKPVIPSFTTTQEEKKEEEKKQMTFDDYNAVRDKFACCKGSDSKYRFIPNHWCPKITDGCSGYCGGCVYRDLCKK